MEKINLVEILKDCPKGMELDCTMFEGIEFDSIVDNDCFPIRCRIKNSNDEYNFYSFTKRGYWNNDYKAKCVIFPKGRTTWKGFVPPCQFKDGDIISNDKYIAIFYKIGTPCHCTSSSVVYYHCYYSQKYCNFKKELDFGIGIFTEFKYATEEERQKLFNVIKANGYKWNEETKTLEKLVEPRFKVGDRVKSKINQYEYTIADIRKDVYIMYYATDKFGYHVPFCNEDNYELVPNKLVKPRFKVGDRIQWTGTHVYHPIRVVKSIEWDRYRLDNGSYINFGDEHAYTLLKFDINTLKPFDRVLVRCSTLDKWHIQFFEKYDETCKYPFICMGYNKYKECIPYEGNEHLLGTNNECNEYFKTWK